jgi:hypothetical protein
MVCPLVVCCICWRVNSPEIRGGDNGTNKGNRQFWSKWPLNWGLGSKWPLDCGLGAAAHPSRSGGGGGAGGGTPPPQRFFGFERAIEAL